MNRIAVVTPYCGEPEAMLRQCHDSVIRQGVAADHLMVGDGRALAAIDGWPVRHVRIPGPHGDNGNTPRGIGSLLAKAEGYEFVAYLDADNWFHADHLASLLALHEQTRSPVCTALRTFHGPGGETLGLTEEDEDALRHVDTSAYLIHRSAFAVLDAWLAMPRAIAPICDRVFLGAILHARFAVQSTGQRTVAFRSRYAAHYERLGLPVPADARGTDFAADALRYLATSRGVTECVAALGFWPGSYVSL